MQQPQAAESQPFFSFPVGRVPTSLWITDLQLIVVHRSGLLKSLPVLLGRRIDKITPGRKETKMASRLASAHRAALAGKCATWSAEIYREAATIMVSPVRDGGGKIVGTIGRVESEELCSHCLPHLSVNIVRSRMATGRQSDLKALADALLANSAYGVCVLDMDGTVSQWNGAMETLTGISARLACGASLASLFPALFECDPQTLTCLANGEHLWLRDFAFHFGEGEERYFDVSLIPLLGEGHSLQGSLGIFSDVTSRVRVCRERDDLQHKLENLKNSLYEELQPSRRSATVHEETESRPAPPSTLRRVTP